MGIIELAALFVALGVAFITGYKFGYDKAYQKAKLKYRPDKTYRGGGNTGQPESNPETSG